MKICIHSLILATLCLWGTGCHSDRPADMPKLVPVQLTFVQEGKPVADVAVGLTAEDPSSKYGSGGMTDANGVVKLQTHGKYLGVPEGKYIVTASKQETVQSGPWDSAPKDGDEAAQRTWYEQNKNKLKTEKFWVVNQKYATQKTSDLIIEVGTTPIDQTFDLGKPIKVKLSANEMR